MRGRLHLMASGIDLPKNNENLVFGLIQAYQDKEMLKLFHTAILASAILKNDKKTNELVSEAIKLIYFEEGKDNKVDQNDADLLKDLRNTAFKIDLSSIPMDQDRLIRKK